MNIDLMDADQVRAEVRKHYGERVQQQASCCGGSSSVCCGDASEASDGASGSALYSADELALVPAEAAAVSYGCGNPTALASLRPGEVVLDLGSGGGIDVLIAAQRVGPQGYVYGVDMTDEMLDLARRNATRRGATNVEFRKGYLEELPLPDAGVDVIISNCVINLSPDKGKALHEAFRVLKPGGRLAVSDVVIDGDLSDLPVSEAQVRAALSWAGCVAGALTADDFRARLAEAGFEAIAVDVKHRYSLEDLGQDSPTVEGLPDEVARKLVGRFTSANISARRPVETPVRG
jgi:SAM-dependent methyltransferase